MKSVHLPKSVMSAKTTESFVVVFFLRKGILIPLDAILCHVMSNRLQFNRDSCGIAFWTIPGC